MIDPRPVDMDPQGLAVAQHIASHHVAGGEVTLCGAHIDYATWQGTAPGAPPCPECERLDA